MTFLLLLLGVEVLTLIGFTLFKKLKILDKPGKDVPKRKRVPTLQGIVLIINFFVLWITFYPEYFTFTRDNPFLWLFLWWLLIALLSFIDELWRISHKSFTLSPPVRLFWQVAAALLALFISGVGILEFQLPWWYLLQFWLFSILVLTIVWYALFTNAINRFDGVYGLSSGISSIWFLTIFLLLYFVVFPTYPNMFPERLWLLQWVQWVSLILFLLSFVALIMERKPWWLLRDVGTMFLWFSLAYLSLLWWAKIGTMVVVLALPLFDAIWVFIDRLHRRKKHPMKWDYSHLHYRLMALWWNRNEVRVFILGWSVFLVVLMLLLWSDRVGKVIIFILMALIFFGVNYYLYRVKGLECEYKVKTEKQKKWKVRKLGKKKGKKKKWEKKDKNS